MTNERTADEIDLTASPAKGVKILRNLAGTPDADGLLGRHRLVTGPFRRGCYFVADRWPRAANRVLPHTFESSYGRLREGGIFALLELADGRHLAIVPVTGSETTAWLSVSDGQRLMLNLGTLGRDAVACDAPLVAWSKAANAYTACRQAWAEAITSRPAAGRTTLRHRKHYPEPFEYLGWCSWEEYHKDITSDLLVEAVRKIERSGLPIRFVLIDDGHQANVDRQMMSFEPDARKFPDGWAPLVAMRKDRKVRWFGIWHAMQGLWECLATDNDFGPELNGHLAVAPASRGETEVLLPRNDPACAAAFYEAMIGSAGRHGFDFVKIDDQASNVAWYRTGENAVQAAARNAQALEAAVERHLAGMINCMAHNGICLFNTRHSAVTRCSIDYHVGRPTTAKSHIWQSYHNTPWLCQTVWPDHDMFHSSDEHCGGMMAISKAMSGGPVYLSDAPESFVADYIRPLCYEDGRLLRPIAPAAPLSDSLFIDPMRRPVAYRAIAPLPGRAAAVAAYNLTEPTSQAPLQAAVAADDYTEAAGMIQPHQGNWAVPEEGLLAYDWHAGTAVRLDGPYEFQIAGFADRLIHLCPIRHGWAVIGRTDKYLSPAAVEVLDVSPNELTICLVESGPLGVWSERGRPSAEGAAFVAAGAGLYKADLPPARGEATLTITR